jgi:hypothetical protein
MALPPPDLSTREGIAAYRRELFGVARPLRWSGLACVIVGAILILQTSEGWRGIVQRTDGLAGVVLIVIGWVLMIGGIIQRTRYHKKRLRGLI